MMKPIIKNQRSTHEMLYHGPAPRWKGVAIGSAVIGRIVLERDIKISCSSQRIRASTFSLRTGAPLGTIATHFLSDGCTSLTSFSAALPIEDMRPAEHNQTNLIARRLPINYPEPTTGYRSYFPCSRSRLAILKRVPASGLGKLTA